MPLLVSRNLWRYIDGDGKSKYCVRGNDSWQNFMDAKRGCRIIGFSFLLAAAFSVSIKKAIG
jgi:hypothetical protein